MHVRTCQLTGTVKPQPASRLGAPICNRAVTPRHTLIAPGKHVTSIFELTAQEQAELWSFVAKVRQRLLTGLKSDGFNIGVNDGFAAGQTIEHAHVHISPRRMGDVQDPRGGIRWIVEDKANYWAK
jgi:diadenosine tetraphosphate (Ap4A) HIT family hydrolase